MQAKEPTTIRAGDTAAWRKTLPDYSAADGWQLQYSFLNSAQRYAINAVADGIGFVATVTPVVSAEWLSGRYTWVGRVSRGAAEIFTIASGTVEILPDITNAADLRSHAQKVLTSIEAVIENRATLDQEEYSIAGRMLKRTPIAELIKLRDQYRREVRRESGDSRGRKLLVRF